MLTSGVGTINEDVKWPSLVRRVRRLFRMVHEFHKIGYQGMRVRFGVSGSGAYYRLHISPASLADEEGFALDMKSNEGDRNYKLSAHYSTSEENYYFNWTDTPQKTPRQLVNMFLLRFPELCEHSYGEDWEYAGWYTRLMGEIENGFFPQQYSGDYPEINKEIGLYLKNQILPGERTRRFIYPPIQKNGGLLLAPDSVIFDAYTP